MLEDLANLLSRFKARLSLLTASFIFWAVMLVSYPLVSGVTSRTYGEAAWLAGLVAVLICGIAGQLALLISGSRREGLAGMSYIMTGMLVTMFIPLFGMVVADKKFATMKLGAMASQLVIFFLIMLTIETILTLQVKPRRSANPVSPAALEEVARNG